jgi:hypothetical protein
VNNDIKKRNNELNANLLNEKEIKEKEKKEKEDYINKYKDESSKR